MKYLHKILLGLSLFGAVFASAADSSDTISVADSSYVRLGVGGIYFSQHAKDTDVNNLGGYFNFHFALSDVNERFRLGGGLKVGTGKSEMSGVKIPSTADSSARYFAYEGQAKLGVNLLSQNNPLYANVFYAYDAYLYDLDNGRKYDKSRAFALLLNRVGLELEGITKKSPTLHIEYSLAYDYVVDGDYYIARIPNQAAKSQVNAHTIQGSVGFRSKISTYFHYYMKAVAKYQHLNASKVVDSLYYYPKSARYYGGIEIGLGF